MNRTSSVSEHGQPAMNSRNVFSPESRPAIEEGLVGREANSFTSRSEIIAVLTLDVCRDWDSVTLSLLGRLFNKLD